DEPWFGPEDVDLYAVNADRTEPTEGEGLVRRADIRGPLRAFVEGPDGSIAAVGSMVPDAPRSYDQNDLLVFVAGSDAPRVLTADLDCEVGDGIGSDCHPPAGGGAMPLGFNADASAVFTVIGRRGSAQLAAIEIATGALRTLTGSEHEVIAGTIS